MEEKKFNTVYKEFAGGIFRYIFFKVSDYEVAADLTADTFTRFWKVTLREPIDNAKAFLFSIANGIIIDYYRKKKRQKKVSLDVIDEWLLGVMDKNEDMLSNKQEITYIFLKLKKLKKTYQDILLLYYVEELKIEEISLILHKTENNTRVMLHRALQALKKNL
jgi:RNA polymerase sigma-70 factor (ECF subfamily)